MMRFCPFCSAENADDAAECRSCGRRLPPLPPRRDTPASVRDEGNARTLHGGGPEPLPPPPRPRRLSQPPPTPGAPSAAPPAPAVLVPGGDPDPAFVAARDEPSGPVIPDPTLAPPPTRLAISLPGSPPGESLPAVDPLPEVPDNGLLSTARYTVGVARGVWQRRSAVKNLNAQIRLDTSALDQLLGELGRTARGLKLDNRVLRTENQAIDEAEVRRARARLECSDLAGRLEEENQRFAEQDAEREEKLAETEADVDTAANELSKLEAQRRALRDKRKTIERQQKAYLKAARDRENEAARQEMGDARQELRRAAEDLRQDAAGLDPERQDVERRLGALEKPLSQAAAKVEALRGELDSHRRALHDAREGHRHRLAELEGEQVGKSRDMTQAEAEVARRLVTLGTLVNLNRIERPEFDELYAHIDQLHGSIGACTRQIERLDAERASYSRPAVVRGALVLSLGAVLLITALVLLFALL